MELVLSKAAVKFLEKLTPKGTEKLQDRLATLLRSLETEGIIPFNELDIKSLKGDWKGFFRMRVGKVRVVFTIDSEADALQIYDIAFRGNIYKALFLGSTTIRLPVTQKLLLQKAIQEQRPDELSDDPDAGGVEGVAGRDEG